MRSAPSGSPLLAPDLLRRALHTGIVVGWEPTGAVFAQITNRRSWTQRAAFDALTANRWAPDVLTGDYYAGDFRRMQ